MTNIELMEQAAKAANFPVYRGKDWQNNMLFRDSPQGGSVITGIEWNPIEDDADAFRLMVHAGLLVEMVPDQQMVIAWDQNEVRYREWWGDVTGAQCADACEATRRAIVKSVASAR